jgi:Tol biopolymer transport system component
VSRLRIVVMNRDGTAQRTLGRGYGPKWSPDGKLVAFVDPPQGEEGPSKLEAGDVLVAAADGSGNRVVGTGTTPAWSPNGRLAFMKYTFGRDRDGDVVITNSQLFLVEGDGTRLQEVQIPSGLQLLNPDWAPDGHTLVFGSYHQYDEDPYEVLFVDVDHPEHLGSASLGRTTAYVWSPDGGLLAFSDGEGVKVGRADGSDVRTLSNGLKYPSTPVWAPDGSALAFDACFERKGSDDQTCDVYVAAADGSKLKRVTRTPGREGGVHWGP